MANWEINKGIGRTVEFKGLKAQYLFLFAGGLLAVFILVVVLYLCGVSQMLCLVIGVVGATIIVWQTFAMNRKYGQYGLMKKGAVRMHPRYLVNRRTTYHLIRNLKRKKERRMVAATIRKIQAPNQEAAVLLVSGSPELSSRSAPLLGLSPLRTVRDTFASYGSSNTRK